MYGVQLSKQLTPVSPEGNYRLQVWVSEYTDDTDPKIFTYQRQPTIPKEEDDPDDQFVAVSSAGDMAEYPVDDPNDDGPFFRKSFLDLEFESVDLLNRSWTFIKRDVADLINNLNGLYDETTTETEVITI